MNDKKIYQVFVSSTYEDLKEERNKVLHALLRVNCIPIGMEYFNAADEDQFTVIKELISSCDYYVLILGGKYGSIEEKSQKSYTQLEYEYAKEQKIPTIAFFPENPFALTGDKIEQDPKKKTKLESFTAMVKTQLCMSYTNSDNLALNIITSLNKLQNSHPSVGWVRGNQLSSDEANKQILELQKENKIIKQQLLSYTSHDAKERNRLQQNDDKYTITIYSGNSENPFGLNLQDKPIILTLSWDEIFKIVAPYFISSVQTNLATESIDKAICEYKECPWGHYLYNQCAQTIIAQFYALGYIKLQSGEVFQNGVVSYYVLTELGMRHFVELTALKK